MTAPFGPEDAAWLHACEGPIRRGTIESLCGPATYRQEGV